MSRPLRLALEAGLIVAGDDIFDYGCGRGEDLEWLRREGLVCEGWDPIHRPDVDRRPAAVVNLGYVVNVVEDPVERQQTLLDAWSLARRLLVVSARLDRGERGAALQPFADGCITTRSTFQKFFTQSELGQWIDSVLRAASVAAGPGIFLVFRDEELRQAFLSSRFRRRIAAPRVRQSEALFEAHRDLLEQLMRFVSDRGRLPDDRELNESEALKAVFGGLQRAFTVVTRVTGSEQWEKIRQERQDDLAVFLALERFRGRPQYSKLSPSLQLDVKRLFGSYTHACDVADRLLMSAGNAGLLNGAFQECTFGKQTRDALYVHRPSVPRLPVVLRVYEGCARAYIGEVEGANVVKLGRDFPQVSYLAYSDLDREPHPALIGSLVVSLRKPEVRYLDYSTSDNPPILHRKELLFPLDYPLRPKFESLTKSEERHGLYEMTAGIGSRAAWNALLEAKGLRLVGHRVVRARRAGTGPISATSDSA
jgi:DNA phosphorothioation-associated putative methyltransferase